MALIKCPECGKMVSDKAYKCPHCNSPIKNIKKAFLSAYLKILAVFVGAIIVAICLMFALFAYLKHLDSNKRAKHEQIEVVEEQITTTEEATASEKKQERQVVSDLFRMGLNGPVSRVLHISEWEESECYTTEYCFDESGMLTKSANDYSFIILPDETWGGEGDEYFTIFKKGKVVSSSFTEMGGRVAVYTYEYEEAENNHVNIFGRNTETDQRKLIATCIYNEKGALEELRLFNNTFEEGKYQRLLFDENGVLTNGNNRLEKGYEITQKDEYGNWIKADGNNGNIISRVIEYY